MKRIERRNLHYVTKNLSTLPFYSNCFGLHTLLKSPFSIIMFYLNKDYLCNLFFLSNHVVYMQSMQVPYLLVMFFMWSVLMSKVQKFKVKKVKKLLVSWNQNNLILRRSFFQEFFFKNFRLIYCLKYTIFAGNWKVF